MVFAMYHPAAALRTPEVERESYEDVARIPAALLELRERAPRRTAAPPPPTAQPPSSRPPRSDRDRGAAGPTPSPGRRTTLTLF